MAELPPPHVEELGRRSTTTTMNTTTTTKITPTAAATTTTKRTTTTRIPSPTAAIVGSELWEPRAGARSILIQDGFTDKNKSKFEIRPAISNQTDGGKIKEKSMERFRSTPATITQLFRNHSYRIVNSTTLEGRFLSTTDFSIQ